MSYSFNLSVRTNLNKFIPVRVCMILSRFKFVGLNLRRSEFTFLDSASLNNLHSMLGWLVFSGAPTFKKGLKF